MRAQSQIRRTLSAPEALDRIASFFSSEEFPNRTALGRRVSEEFGFRDERGPWQLAGCMKALRTLEQRSERITLPAPTHSHTGGGKPTLVAEGVHLAEEVPDRLELVRGLVIRLVEERPQRLIWNTLIAHEHRQGFTTFAGAQMAPMKYLVNSEHGWLGALGFAASALRLEARERWMAWNDALRRAHLDYFRVLKAGCRAERTTLRTGSGLQRAVAIKCVIAWRLVVLALHGRRVPELEPALLFTAQELEFMADYARARSLPTSDSLGTAAQAVAHLGGYRGHGQDRAPSHPIIRNGSDKLTSATVGRVVS